MATRYFRAPVASYDIINEFLTTMVHVGDGTWLGAANINRTRPVVGGLCHWPLHFDPEATGSQIEKETFSCYYIMGDLAPEYTPPEGVEEITQAAWIEAGDTAFPPIGD